MDDKVSEFDVVRSSKKFSEIVKDISPERRKRIEVIKDSLRKKMDLEEARGGI